MLKFKYDDATRERKQQSFDRKSIYWTRNGEKVNVYDFIQENREDTELYPCLERYGSIKRLELDTPAVYGKFEKIMDLRDSLEAEKQAVNMWQELPLEIRREFNNSRYEFMNNGMEWLKNKLKKEEVSKNDTPKTTTTTESEVKNG